MQFENILHNGDNNMISFFFKCAMLSSLCVFTPDDPVKASLNIKTIDGNSRQQTIDGNNKDA